MCGIAGIVDLRGAPVERSELERMARIIHHRGPDDDGVWARDNVGLANVRLAIIDVSAAGRQPMRSDDGSVVLAYNGELYNFADLRRELAALGYAFQSATDTEVVLRAYEEWGERCLDRFNGMYAFAVWDERSQKLFVARDRFGIKPLYYALHDGRFLFASEIKGLLEAGLPARVSAPALVEYFTFQNVLSDLTLFDGVHLLPPAHTLTLQNGVIATRQHWDLEFDPDGSVSSDEWSERIRVAFDEAVIRQLVSDVPLGSYLSGGMDSASIVAVASRAIPRLMTFTGGFDMSNASGIEVVFDERQDAELTARTFRTEHYEMVIHAGDMAWVLPELVWHLEDLRVGMSYQNHYIARLASKFVKVALAGTGGDELFAGYPWRYARVEHAHDDAAFDRAYYGYWTRLIGDAARGSFFTRETLAAAAGHEPFDAYRAVLRDAPVLDPVSKALYFETKTFLHGLLVVEDKVSMAHGLEARVPFLDNAVVDVARRIPASLKHSGADGKPLLRDAMRKLLPASLVEKRKQGFSPPDESWYRGPTMEYIRSLLLDSRSVSRGYFEPRAIENVLHEHVHGRMTHRLLIWSLMAFEWWNRLFIDGEPASRHRAWHVSAVA